MSRERMMQDLELAGHAESTRSMYLNSIGDLAKFHWRAPEQLGQEEVRSWVDHLSKQLGLSASRKNGHFCALRFYYGKTLGKPDPPTRGSRFGFRASALHGKQAPP